MRARQQSETVRPERPKGVHEYRAALLSVFMHADSREDLSGTLTPDLQPVPLQDAIELIAELPDEQHDAAKEVAGCKLASAVVLDDKPELEPYLKELIGVDGEELKAMLHGLIPTPPDGTPWLNYDVLRQAFYGGGVPDLKAGFSRRTATPTPAPPTPVQTSTRSDALAALGTCFADGATPAGSGGESKLDLVSLVTTVDIPSQSYCDFATLARVLDPRSWSLSPFWPESYEVQLSEDRRGFSRPATTNENGESWRGYLYEHVEWNWNVETVASFQNFLDINYVVDEEQQTLRLDFALYSCEGSQLYLLQQRRGIDVDSGFQCVAPVPHPAGPQVPSFRLRTLKNIRYTDLLDRQTPGQGPAGAGQFLSYLAPAVVGLWMNELIRRLYCQP
jgi:hypothetical protein